MWDPDAPTLCSRCPFLVRRGERRVRREQGWGWGWRSSQRQGPCPHCYQMRASQYRAGDAERQNREPQDGRGRPFLEAQVAE